MKEDWRSDLSPLLKDYLEELVKATTSEKESYNKAKDKKIAQLWVALALLYKENQDIKQRLKIIERVLKDKNQKRKKKDDIDPAKALKDVLKKL